MQIGSVQRRIYEIVEKASDGDRASFVFDIVIMGLVLGNVIGVVVETVPSIAHGHPAFFRGFEAICVVIFTLELALRFFCAGADPRYVGLRGRLRFLFRPIVIIDIVAILPFFLPLMMATNAHAMQSLRMFRLLRLLKMGRYLESMQMLGRVARDRRDQLLGTLFIVTILLTVAASLMYVVEHDAQPDVFSSIPMAMWWAVATLTTVGYGDIYPITPMGRVLGATMALLGVGMFALPAGIIGSGFADELAKKREAAEPKLCPHCHARLDHAPEDAPEAKSA